MYTEQLMQHFANPHNVGVIEDADGIGQVENSVYGDMVTFYIKVKNDTIEDVKCQATGCIAAIAVSSQVTEMVKGKSLLEAKALTQKAVAEALGGLPKDMVHCFNLGAEALQKAIRNYETSAFLTTSPVKKTDVLYKRCGSCWTKNSVTLNYCMCCGVRLK